MRVKAETDRNLTILTLLRNNAADTAYMFFRSLTGNRVFSFPLALKENAVEPLTMGPSLLPTVPLALNA